MTISTRPQAIAYATSPEGLSFAVRIVVQGDRYGRDGCLTHEKQEPMVEFYDASQAGRWDDIYTGHLGQFTGGRYYVSTLKDHRTALSLDGGVPSWTVTGASLVAAMRAVVAEIGLEVA